MCSFLLYSKVIQLYICIFLFHILFHYGLSQDIEYSFLCYTVGPCCLSILYIIVCIWGFPGGAVVGSLPANAGDTGSSPGLGGSHMPRSNWTCEPQLLSLRVWSLCSSAGEAAIVRGPRTAMKSGPRLPQLEKALAQKRRPSTATNKLIN